MAVHIIPDNGYAMELDAADMLMSAKQIGIDHLAALKAHARNGRQQRVVIRTATEVLTTYVGNLEEYAAGLSGDDMGAAEDFFEEQG